MSLADVLSSTVFDLDATQAESYPGTGQSWKNLASSPADGSSQSAYDFPLGATLSATTDDPTFVGPAGTAAAYFSLDGGDYFRFLNVSNNTTFLKALHKTTGSTPWWMAIACQPANVASQTVFATNTSSASIGMRISLSSSSQLQLGQRGDSATVSSTAVPVLANGTDYLFIITYDPVSGARRMGVNSATLTQAAFAFNTTSTDCNGPATIASAAIGSTGMASGTRFYAMAAGNTYIGDAEAAQIIAAYEARHGRDYVSSVTPLGDGSSLMRRRRRK